MVDQPGAGISPEDAARLLGTAEQHVEGLLALIGDAARRDDLPTALRWGDRLMRLYPQDPTLVAVVARLMLRSGRLDDGLALLARVEPTKRGTELGVVASRLLLAKGNLESAVLALEETMSAHPVETIAELDKVAPSLSAGSGWRYAGWAGLAVDGTVIGAVRSDWRDRLTLRGGVSRSQTVTTETPAGPFAAFRFRLPAEDGSAKFALRAGDRRLIGGEGLRWPPPPAKRPASKSGGVAPSVRTAEWAERRADDMLRFTRSDRPTMLLITLARDGGVTRHVRERALEWASKGWRVVELKPILPVGSDGACRITVHGEDYQELVYVLPEEEQSLMDLLSRGGVGSVEIHHALGLAPLVLDLPRRLGASYDIFVHDYSWICPRITLIGGDGLYCGEPPVTLCESCIRLNGVETEEEIAVEALRQRSAALFAGARQVVVPSSDVALRLGRYFPSLSPVIRSWEMPVSKPPKPPVPSSGRLRVALIGAIGPHKGYNILLECARDAAARDLPLDFVVIGHTSDDAPLFETGRVFVTGPYEENELPALLAREACQVALLPSVWPETWNYALTHLLRAGLPIVAFDLGAVAERLRRRALTRLLPLARDPVAVNEALLSLRPVGPAARIHLYGGAAGEQGQSGAGWARLPTAGSAIEQFAIDLPGGAGAEGIECKGITASGVETPWVADGVWCGTRSGGGLIAFAVRAPLDRHSAMDCLYSGEFASGAIVDGIRNGAPCRSPRDGDPLVALRVELTRRALG